MIIDFPYIFFLLILLGFTFLSFRNQDKKMFKLATIVVLLFLGLRAPIVGADTWDYYRYFTGVRDYYNEDQRDLEVLFVAYVKILQTILLKIGPLIMLTNTFFSFVMLYCIVKDFSPYKTLSVLLFFIIGPWTIYFVALRQILALTCVLYGVIYVTKEKKLKWVVYSISVLIGWGFHTSAIIAGAGYFLLYFLPLYKKYFAIGAVLLSALIGVAFQMLNIDQIFSAVVVYSGFMTERLDNYLLITKYIEDVPTSPLVLFRMSIVAILSIAFLPKEKVNHWFTKIFLVGICLNNFFFSVVNITRGVLPFIIFSVIVVAWGIEGIKKQRLQVRMMAKGLVLVILLYFVRAFVVENIDYDIYADLKMHPYQFVFENYSHNPIFKHPDIQ